MAFWIVWLILGVFFILAFSAVIIPKLIFRVYAAASPVRVKVVERFAEKYGETLVCSPDAKTRKYLKSYRIFHGEKGLYFRGERARRAALVEYEISAYDAQDNLLDVIFVRDKFCTGRNTADIPLPEKTDYVNLRIVCVDDSPIPAERRAFGLKFALWLTALCLCVALACDLLSWLIITFALRCIDGFTTTFTLPVSSWAAILGFTALAAVIFTASISVCAFFLRKKEDEYAAR